MKTLPRVAVVGAACTALLLSLLTPSCGGSATENGKGAAGAATGGSGAASGAGGSTAASGTGGSTAASGAGGSSPTTETCITADDCIWGEINLEILRKSDCICLFGCPYLPQTKTTQMRRAAQYAALCDPNTDGTGAPCPIDDCALPGPITCTAGVCAAAVGGGSGTQ